MGDNFMDNLLSGFIGALLGVVISSIVSICLFKKQMRFESNRYFLVQLIEELQNIYTAQLSQLEINDKSMNIINAFQVIIYKEFKILEEDLENLKDAILKYREGRSKSLSSTTTSMEEVQARKSIDSSIKNIMQKIRKVT